MAFDALSTIPTPAPTAAIAPLSVVELLDASTAPCPEWAARNPNRALALLFVAPCDCDAVDVLTAH
jgi:hypothetical protein